MDCSNIDLNASRVSFQTVWPEFCKNSPPWQIFESFGPFFEGLISIRQNWTYFCKKLCYWGNWHSCKWPKLKNNQSIWSRWFFYTKFYAKRWDVDDLKLQKCFSQKILIDLKRCKIYFTPFYEERERASFGANNFVRIRKTSNVRKVESVWIAIEHIHAKDSLLLIFEMERSSFHSTIMQ